jgi:catechol 2,3-dioxygenase-like lactoylglutathione lyase family enzyme
MTDAAFHVKSIDHVTIVVKDLAATRWFYVDALGMTEVPRPNFSFAGQWFQAGPTLIHTILEFEGSEPAGIAGAKNTRGHHLAFLVDDARAAEERMRALSVPVVRGASLRPDGAVQVFVHDPDGHLIELTSG